MKRLNFGCGTDYREGWVNLDVARLPKVDVVHDINQFPYPFEDNEFDYILARHALEHVPHHIAGYGKDGFILVMEEFHRILKPGGTLEAVSPYYEADSVWQDPTHTRPMHPEVFSYFSDGVKWSYYSTARFELVERRISGWVARVSQFLPVGPSRLGIMQHIALRAPWLGGLVRKPYEMTWILRCVKHTAESHSG